MSHFEYNSSVVQVTATSNDRKETFSISADLNYCVFQCVADMNADKTHYRFYTFTRQKLGKSAIEIHQELTTAWGDDVPSLRTVQRWLKNITEDVELSDAARSGRPRTSRTDEMTALVSEMIEDDPHLSSRDLATLLNSDHSTILRILREDLQMRFVCSVWVPHQLSDDHRELRVNCAKHLRRVLLAMKDDKYNLYAIEDETWVPWDAHGTKSDNRTWLRKDEPRKQVVRTSAMTTRKSLLLVMFTANKRFSVQALPYGTTVDTQRMIDFLRRTGDRWRTLRSKPVRLNQISLQMDNARPHTASLVKDFLKERNVTTIWQSPYSPDLNLCDRFLFVWLKNELRGKTFNSSSDVEEASLQYLRSISEDALHEQVNSLIDHCQQVIDAQGDYITD